jgi:hypothetical protein
VEKLTKLLTVAWKALAILAVLMASLSVSIMRPALASAAQSCESATSVATFDYAYSRETIVPCRENTLHINSGYKSNAKDGCNGKIIPFSQDGQVGFKIPERKYLRNGKKGKCGFTLNFRAVKCRGNFAANVWSGNPVQIECQIVYFV